MRRVVPSPLPCISIQQHDSLTRGESARLHEGGPGESRQAPPVSQPVWPDSAAAHFARWQRYSDGIPALASAIRSAIGQVAELLDIGAGTGVLGASLLRPGGHHRALEPNGYMARRLRRDCPRHLQRTVIEAPWQAVLPDAHLRSEAVLCANIPGLVEEAAATWRHVSGLAQRHLVWIVPAQAAPRSWCLSGFLPPHLHGSDTTPGIAITQAQLAGIAPEPQIIFVDWTWRVGFASRPAAIAWFTPRLQNPTDPTLQAALATWCHQHLKRAHRGWIAEAPKRSAIMLWSF